MVHCLDSKGGGAAVAPGAFITLHPRQGGRNMIAWLGFHACIATVVAGGAISCSSRPGRRSVIHCPDCKVAGAGMANVAL